MQHGRSEILEYGDLGVHLPADCFSDFNAATHHDDVDIGTWAVQEVITHVASDDKGTYTFFVGDTADSAE